MKVISFRKELAMTSEEMRANPLFMRNTFPTVGKWGMPIIKKQELPTSDIYNIAKLFNNKYLFFDDSRRSNAGYTLTQKVCDSLTCISWHKTGMTFIKLGNFIHFRLSKRKIKNI